MSLVLEMTDRVEGGEWVFVRSASTVIGWVEADLDPEVNWTAHPTWTGGLAPLVDCRARGRAIRALLEAWEAAQADEPEAVPQP